MGIYDRDYSRPQSQQQHYAMGSGIRGITPVVKWLLIINFAVFIVNALVFKDLVPEDPKIRFTAIDYHFSVFPATKLMAIQIWRVITYQFLHADVGHLVFNLFVLFMFGPMVEGALGSKAFIKFYLICGAVGGVLYTLVATMGILDMGHMRGASGAIFGVLSAAAILFPKTKVLVMLIFPMTIVWMVVLMIIMSFLFILKGENVGGELAHMSGLAMGFLYMKYRPWITRRRMERQKGAWTQKVERERNFQSEVDRVLDKVHHEGINKLSSNEKKILQEATRREQEGQ